MTNAWQSIQIKQFEQVMAGPTTCLLRISGKAPRLRGAGPRPTLLVDTGQADYRFPAISAPPDTRGLLRAAYTLPAALVGPATRYSLEHADGSLTELPQPEPGVGRAPARTAPVPTAMPQPSAPRHQRPSAIRALTEPSEPPERPDRPSELLAKLAEQSEALELSERDAAESDQARRLAESNLGRLRSQLTALEQRLVDAEASAEQRAGDGSATPGPSEADEQRAADAEARLTAAEQRAEDAEARLADAKWDSADTEEQLRSALAHTATARERGESLEARNAELERTLTEQTERLKALEQELADRHLPHDDLQREVEALRSSCASLELEVDQTRDQARIMTFERDEMTRQVSAFDEVAVKARERAAQAEASNEQLSATLHELETWRGELERRLTATTTELGVAKTARAADERELKRLGTALAEAEAQLEHGDGRNGEAIGDLVGDSAQTLAAQAAEIERLAAELASLRTAGVAQADTATAARLATLEAERAEIVRRAEQLAELVRTSVLESDAGGSPEDLDLISRQAERTAREQAERELRSAASDSTAARHRRG